MSITRFYSECMKSVVLFFVLFGITSDVFGQRAEPAIKHFSVEEGLPGSEVYLVIQDSKGYMWFATDRGAVRYNGYHFQVFTTKHGLCDNSVLGIHEDQYGRVWFYTYSKQLSYFENGKIHNCKANNALKNLIGYNIPCDLTVEEDGSIIVGFKVSRTSRRFVRIDSKGSVEPFDFYAKDSTCYAIVHQNKDGRYLRSLKQNMDSNNLVVQYHGKAPIYFNQIHTGLESGFSLYPLSDTSFLISFKNCIYEVTGDSMNLLFCDNSPSTFGLFKDPENNIWVASRDSGVRVHDPATGQLLYSFLQDKIVTWVQSDAEGGIWLTTLNDGVFYIPSFSIKCLRSTVFFKNKRINDIHGLGNNIYLGYYQNQRITQVNYTDNLMLHVNPIPHQKAVKHALTHVPRSNPDYLVISGLFEGENSSVLRYSHGQKNDSIALHGTRQVIDMGDSLILLNGNAIYVYNMPLQKLDVLCRFDKTSSYDCFHINLKTNKIWLGNRDGLTLYHNGHLQDLTDSNPLLNYRITAIDKSGENMVLATLGAGVVFVSPDSIWNMTREEGLVNNMCNSVSVDKEGLIWVSTNAGLSRIAPDGLYVTNYTNSSGLLSDEVDETLILDSFVWVKNDNGLSVFNKYRDQDHSSSPRIYIERFSVNNHDTSVTKGLELKHRQNHIQIDYSALSYKSGGRILYKYRLRGSDEPWQFTYNTSLVFPKLAPGTYFFEVMGKDYMGNWSKTPASMGFSIKIPFWRSSWFIILEILALFSILMTIVAIRNRQSRLLMRSVQSEQKALQAQLNPHFIFNAMTSIQELLSSGKLKEAKLNLGNMANLLRRILMNSRLSEISIEEEIENLKSYLNLETLRFDNSLNWSINCDPNLEPALTYIPPMLIQPFVENAIWHGLLPLGGGTINIKFSEDKQYICCSILDNGIGREKSTQNKGKYTHRPLGMKIVNERLELLNKGQRHPIRIEINDKLDAEMHAAGTEVLIYIPNP